MRTLPTIALALALALLGRAPTARGGATKAAAPTYRVIVHPSNPNTTVGRKFLEEAFLKKTTSWPGGGAIRPVDLGPTSSIRSHFSSDVLHRSVAEVKSYWQQWIFTGRGVPPPELASDDDVVKYVLKYSGAVGYVAGSTTLNGTKPVAVN
jgi:hypothetical protein